MLSVTKRFSVAGVYSRPLKCCRRNPWGYGNAFPLKKYIHIFAELWTSKPSISVCTFMLFLEVSAGFSNWLISCAPKLVFVYAAELGASSRPALMPILLHPGRPATGPMTSSGWMACCGDGKKDGDSSVHSSSCLLCLPQQLCTSTGWCG